MTQTIQNIALFTAIFASGMLVGYLLKVVLVNKDREYNIEEKNICQKTE